MITYTEVNSEDAWLARKNNLCRCTSNTSLIILLYASWSDYKTREVSNRVWVIYAPIALALSLAGLLLFEPSQLPFYGLSFGVTAGIALLLFYAGGFGGADSKALMCIALRCLLLLLRCSLL